MSTFIQTSSPVVCRMMHAGELTHCSGPSKRKRRLTLRAFRRARAFSLKGPKRVAVVVDVVVFVALVVLAVHFVFVVLTAHVAVVIAVVIAVVVVV